MKKLFLSILAVATLASCTKDESFYTEQDSEIKLAPVTSMATKAYEPVYGSIDGTNYPSTENFKVTAYWTNPGKADQTNVVYLNNVDFTNKGKYWGGTTTYYWPKNGHLQFACYSPATVANVDHEVVSDTYKVEYTQTNVTSETVDFLLAPKTQPYTAETATENVSVVFEHALSWITLQVKAANPEAAKAFTIHDMIINGVNTTGTLSAKMSDGIQYTEWSAQATPATYDVVEGESIDVTAVAAIVEDAPRGTVVIPQVPTTLTINYTQKAMEGTPELTGQTVNVSLELDDETNNIWEPGKHYIYTVIFDLDEILINPSVEDWEDVVVDDKDMDDAGQIATVATEEELKAALEAEVAEIELTSNIELTAQLPVKYSVAFNGGSFSGASIAVTGGVVSFENVVFNNGTTKDNETAVYVYNGNTNVTFDGCTFEGYKYEAIQHVSENALWVSVNNCKFNTEAHRDLHLQVKNLSNAEVKITNNEFNGDDADSYVTVYGFKHERMILEGNTTDTPANTVNVWISNGFDANDMTLNGFVVPTTQAPAAALTESTILGDDYSVATLDLAGNDLDGAGHTLTMTKGTDMYFVKAQKGFISNLKVNGYNARNENNKVTYGIVLTKADGDVVINNVTSTDFAYALNTQITGTSTYTLTVVNSNLEGWTSFSGYKSAAFKNTSFKTGNFFARTDANVENPWNCSVKPYVTTVFENCTFENGFYLDLSSFTGVEVKFVNCTVDGVVLDASNFLTYMNLTDTNNLYSSVVKF